MTRHIIRLLVGKLVLAVVAGPGVLVAADTPFSAMVTLAQAQGFAEIGQYERAITLYHEVTQQLPGAANAWLGLGRAYALDDQYDQAIDPLERAVKLSRDKKLPWNDLGNAHYSLGDYERSEHCYTEALALGEDAVVYYNRGNARRLSGKLDLALSDFDSAIAMDDTDPDFFNDRGIVYWANEDWHQAATDFSKACGMQPEDEIMVQNYRRAIQNLKAWPAMVQSAETLLKKAPDNSETHFMLALGRWHQGQVTGAQREVTAAIDINPEQAEYYELRAEISRRQGRTSDARRDEQRAAELQQE